MFDDFADDLVKAEVTGKGNYLKPGTGLVVIKDVREDSDRSGKKGCIDMMVLKVTAKVGHENDCNTVGETVTKQYKFEDGNADKKAALKAAFKRDLCAIAGKDPRKITGEEFKTLLNDAKELKGVLVAFDSYDTQNKAKEGRTYHNFTFLKQTATDVQKRRKLLDEGAEAGAYL